MKSLILSFLIAPTLFIATALTINGDGRELNVGNKAPMLETKMQDVDGTMYSLLDLKQENGLLVVFSCNTCPFVVGNGDFPGWEVQYNELYNKAKEAKIGFVLINSNSAKRSGDDSLDAMKKHAEDKGYLMHYLVDENNALADAYGAKTTPHLFVIDGKGKIAFKGSIDNSWDSNRSEDRAYAMDVINHLSTGTALKDSSSDPRGCSIKRK